MKTATLQLVTMLAIGLVLGSLTCYVLTDKNIQESHPPVPVKSTEPPTFNLEELPIAVLHAGTDLHLYIPIRQYQSGMQITITAEENVILLKSNGQSRRFLIDTKGEIGIYYSEINQMFWRVDAHIQ